MPKYSIDGGSVRSCASYGDDEFGVWYQVNFGNFPLKFRYITPGSFLMGSTESELCALYNGRPELESRLKIETPQHEVDISYGFWMAEMPCSNAIWRSVTGGGTLDNLPVTNICSDEIESKFISVLNSLFGDKKFFIPSEAQWEYSCMPSARAGSCAKNGFQPGSEDCSEFSGEEYNYWGLRQMLGNVWERCSDSLRRFSGSRICDPVGSHSRAQVCIKGGCHLSDYRGCRASMRVPFGRSARDHRVGFRFGWVERDVVIDQDDFLSSSFFTSAF